MLASEGDSVADVGLGRGSQWQMRAPSLKGN